MPSAPSWPLMTHGMTYLSGRVRVGKMRIVGCRAHALQCLCRARRWLCGCLPHCTLTWRSDLPAPSSRSGSPPASEHQSNCGAGGRASMHAATAHTLQVMVPTLPQSRRSLDVGLDLLDHGVAHHLDLLAALLLAQALRAHFPTPRAARAAVGRRRVDIVARGHCRAAAIRVHIHGA
jgi:hypothetical protein